MYAGGSFGVNNNYYDTEIIKDLVESDLYHLVGHKEDQDYYLGLIGMKFYFIGSKIDWERTHNHIGTKYDDTTLICEAITFINNLQEASLIQNEEVIYIGDGGTDLVYTFCLTSLSILLPVFLKVPQHHYFLPLDCRWCICITTENYLDFGISDVGLRGKAGDGSVS